MGIAHSFATDLTELTFLTTPTRRVYLKHEYTLPSGSLKYRCVDIVLRNLLAENKLRIGDTIVEASSGNAGAALAYCARELGLKCHIFVSDTVTPKKIEKIASFGARVTSIDCSDNPGKEILSARSHAADNGYYYFNQFENVRCATAYQSTLGEELVAQLRSRHVIPSHYVGGIGTGSSIIGVGRALREAFGQNVEIIGVAPNSSPTHIGGLHPGHLRPEGWFLPWRTRPAQFEDSVRFVDDKDAYRFAKELEEKTGYSVGPATGACLYVVHLAIPRGNIVLLGCDSGKSYANCL
jgi:cysteine synthase